MRVTKSEEKIIRTGRCPDCEGILEDRGDGLKKCEDCCATFDTLGGIIVRCDR